MLGRLYLCGCKMDEMTPRHRSMMRALVSGKTPSFVADIFKITESQLSEIMHSPLFKEEMAALEKELEKETSVSGLVPFSSGRKEPRLTLSSQRLLSSKITEEDFPIH